ncbi:MAG: hypothetical protein ACE5MI_14615 [Acidimicrobiia bacterium]
MTLVEFLDEQHVFVIAGERSARISSIDPAELADVARSRVTRGFTARECTTYDIVPCPTLEEIRQV